MGYTELINRLKEKDQKALELIIQNQKDQDEIEKILEKDGIFNENDLQ